MILFQSANERGFVCFSDTRVNRFDLARCFNPLMNAASCASDRDRCFAGRRLQFQSANERGFVCFIKSRLLAVVVNVVSIR